jgi:S-DNA-T family DNA segregation ATPase FtsK/SpoIIIE
VSSKNIESIGKFISELIKELESDRGIEVQLFDIDGFIENKDLETMKKEYASFKDGIAKDEKKSRLCIILGIDKFISNIASDFEQTLSKAEESKNTFFIIADNAAKIKVHEYDPWYKKFTSKDNGIWIGNGMGEQFIITTEQSFAEFRNNYGKSFGYGVSNCEATLIKVLGIYDDEEEL